LSQLLMPSKDLLEKNDMWLFLAWLGAGFIVAILFGFIAHRAGDSVEREIMTQAAGGQHRTSPQ